MKNKAPILLADFTGVCSGPWYLSGSFLTWHVCHRKKNIGFAKRKCLWVLLIFLFFLCCCFSQKKLLIGYLSGNSRFFGWFLSIDHASAIESSICETKPLSFWNRNDLYWNLELNTLYEIMMMFSASIQLMFNQKLLHFIDPYQIFQIHEWRKIFCDCNSASWSSIIFFGKKIFKSIKPIYNHNNKRVYMSHFFLSLIS